MTKRQRLIAWSAIAGLHGAALGGLLFAKVSRPDPVEQPLMVSFISEPAAAPPQTTPPPPPPPPPPPAPAPRMIASTRPTPSPITAPPMVEVVRQEPAPQPPAPPQPAPPSATVAAAPAVTITPPSFTAAYLRNPGPRMPELARRQRHEGIVRLRVQVSADGSPDRVTVQRSSGHAELDAAALEVVSTRWKFVPARQGDRPVPGAVDVPIQFKIAR